MIEITPLLVAVIFFIGMVVSGVLTVGAAGDEDLEGCFAALTGLFLIAFVTLVIGYTVSHLPEIRFVGW